MNGLSEEEKREVIDEVYGETMCAVCNKEFTDPFDVLQVEYLTGIGEKTALFRYENERYEFCSPECLLKWTWDSIVPHALYFPLDLPESVKDLERKRASKKIEEKTNELLRLLDVIGDGDE